MLNIFISVSKGEYIPLAIQVRKSEAQSYEKVFIFFFHIHNEGLKDME